MKPAMLTLGLSTSVIARADLPDGWTSDRPSAWTTSPPGLVRQAGLQETAAWRIIKPTGHCWRCTVVPGPWDGSVGMRFATDANGTGGLALLLENEDGRPGLFLRDPSGKVLWADVYMGWMPYGPLRVEAVTSRNRLYVQALQLLNGELLAQSDWLPLTPPLGDGMALVANRNTAEFTDWERANAPLHQPDPNSPSKLRLQQHGETSWDVTGGGNWQWEDHSRNVLLQKLKAERTTAFITAPRTPDGTWRCRIRLDRDTCGGGMTMLADRDLNRGFLCWLGGHYGKGGLMLYRYPLTSLWSSPQDKWHWDTEYVLEGTVADGRISVRMLAADGTTLIAASPEKALLPEELDRPGMTGFQTWRGTGRFWGFSAQTRATSESPEAAAPVPADLLNSDWAVETGTWTGRRGVNGVPSAIVHNGSAKGRALCSDVKGSRGTFSVRAIPGNETQSVSLLFQVDPTRPLGFELRLGQGCEVRTLAGDVLWRTPDVALKPGQPVILHGIVLTDRLQVRITDAEGEALATSPDCYVPDTNNTRTGILGVSCTGPAEFTNWKWTAE